MKSIPADDYHETVNEPVIGLIPAAGSARRLPGLRGSKEVLPLPPNLQTNDEKVLTDHLLARYAAAGIRRALILTRPGKQDVRDVLGEGSRLGVELSYLDVGRTGSVLETLCRGLPAVADWTIALGFPDILFQPRDAFARLRERLQSENADVALGLFPVKEPERSDMVEVDGRGRVLRIRVKDPGALPGMGWMVSLWRPGISRLMRSWFENRRGETLRELYPGDALQAAVESGFRVTSVAFPKGRSLDVGTPAAWTAARQFSIEPPA